MKKGIRYVLITLAGIILVVLVVMIGSLMPIFNKVYALKQRAEEIVRNTSTEDFMQSRTSIVYDCNDNVLMTYSGEKDIYYVTIDRIPKMLQDAFVVMEDRDYYSHNGVDYKAVIRAAIANYNADEIVQGASTITQQLARNIYLNQDVNWDRKIMEMFISFELEKRYSKDELLEFYLNNIYFGNGYYGVEAAVRGYLGKSVEELTTGECIFIAAIPNNPSKYDPVVHEENTVERARLITGKLHENGYLSDLDYLLFAGTEDNPFVYNFKKDMLKREMNQSTADSYIYTYVTYCAVRYLMEKNGFQFKNEFAEDEELELYDEGYDAWYSYYLQELYSGGYRIYTSLDPDIQQMLQSNVDRVISENDSELQAAAVTIDNETGKVVAVVGGRTELTVGYGINRAYQSFRQPGSAIKPLNVYGPYLCMGHSVDEKVYDVYDENGPKNAEGVYGGEITLREALYRSKNTIAWQIYRYITPQTGCNYLLCMGFKKIYPDTKYMAGALGGFTYGVSAEEMTAGFHAIYNDGYYNPPTCIRAMYREGEVYNEYEAGSKYVYTENAARQLTSMLKSVIEEGTGKGAKLSLQECAGKTGTTNGNKDMWFVGYTGYYTTGVWVGYDTPQTISTENGNIACRIWHDYMEQLHTGYRPKQFTKPDYIFPEVNTELTDLAGVPYETKEGEIDFELLWDNDINIDIIGGDEDSTLPSGDEDSKIHGGDEDSTLPGGDEDIIIPGGDEDAVIVGKTRKNDIALEKIQFY